MIGIIGAMAVETALLEKAMQNVTHTSYAGCTYITGSLNGHDVCLTVSGIGKVNAALCTQCMIDHWPIDIMINTGVAGGIREDISPGDIVVATDLVEHDMDTTHFGDPLGQVPNMDVFAFPTDESMRKAAIQIADTMNINAYTGRIVSGDTFVTSQEKADFLYHIFQAAACEMEGASIAHVCYTNHVRVLVIRAISDNARSGATTEYESFVQSSSQISAKLVANLVKDFA